MSKSTESRAPDWCLHNLKTQNIQLVGRRKSESQSQSQSQTARARQPEPGRQNPMKQGEVLESESETVIR